MRCLGAYPGMGACLGCYCTEVHFIKLYNYTIEHDKTSRAESDGTFGETSNDESEPGISVTTEPKQNHIGFRQSQEETGENNSLGLEDSDGSMTAKRGQCQGKEEGHTIKTCRTKTSEKSKTNEISGKSQEKGGESNSPGLEYCDISMSAEAYGAAEITGQSQEKSGDRSSPGLGNSDGSMTAKRGQSQGKKTGHTIKTHRRITSEKSKTAEIT